jgi:hypothetical protein
MKRVDSAKIVLTDMPFTVTTRKRGGAEHTNLAHTEGAAMSLALMMRRASDEYCCESMVTVRDNTGSVVAAWRGGGWGWQPLAQSPCISAAARLALQPLAPKVAPTAASRFMRVPTEPLQSDPSISVVTEHSAA